MDCVRLCLATTDRESLAGIEILTSAPSRIILFGEHGFVYGSPAITATIDKRAHVNLRTTTEKCLSLNFFNVQVRLPLPLELNHLNLSRDCRQDQLLTFLCIKKIYSCMSPKCLGDDTGVRVDIKGTHRMDGGLGSSGALCVSLCAAFLTYDYLLNNKPVKEKDGKICEILLQEIRELSKGCEKVFHQEALGIDVASSILGGIVLFHKQGDGEKISDCLHCNIAVVDTKVQAVGNEVCADVARLRNKHKVIVDNIFDTMQSVVKEAAIIIQEKVPQNIYIIFDLARINHGLLYALNCSHPILEKIASEINEVGAVFKLTALGRGGNGLCFFTEDAQDKIYDVLKKTNLPFLMFKSVGVPGLRLKVNRNTII